MAGLLPIMARRIADATDSLPAEAQLPRDTWLARAGVTIRGYLNSNWRVEVLPPPAAHARAGRRRADIISAGPIVGSRMHVNFASQPELLRRFFHPKRTAAQPAASSV